MMSCLTYLFIIVTYWVSHKVGGIPLLIGWMMEAFNGTPDSDEEGEEFFDHKFNEPTTEFDLDKEELVDIGEPNNINAENFIELDARHFGDLGVPKPKEGWENALRRYEDRGKGPQFIFVDNPGGWHPSAYTAKFSKKKKNAPSTPSKPGVSDGYLCHSLPTGAQPCPGNFQQPHSKPQSTSSTTDRVCKGWSFHYLGFTSEFMH